MAKENRTQTSIVKVSGDANYLAAYAAEDHSLDNLEQYKLVPRIKVVQSMSDDKLKEQFGEASAIIFPGEMLLAKKGEPFFLVPLFSYTEFCKWRALDDRNKEQGPIVERSVDPDSEIAKRARDPLQRTEDYTDGQSKAGKPLQFRYVEHINFPSVIYGQHDQTGQHVSLSFSKGEFGVGRQFSNGLLMRRVSLEDGVKVRPPLWAQVWSATPAPRSKGTNKWFGLDMKAPTPEQGVPNLILPEEVEAFKELHLEMSKLFGAGKLGTDYKEEDPDPANSVNPNDPNNPM